MNLFSLIWAFSVRLHILQYPLILLVDNDGPDQPVLMCRLIRVCIVRKSYKGPFCVLHIICACGVLIMKSHYNILSIHLICKSASFNVTGCSCAMKQICQFLQKSILPFPICAVWSGLSFSLIYFTVSTDSVHGHYRPWSDFGNVNIITITHLSNI